MSPLTEAWRRYFGIAFTGAAPYMEVEMLREYYCTNCGFDIVLDYVEPAACPVCSCVMTITKATWKGSNKKKGRKDNGTKEIYGDTKEER